MSQPHGLEGFDTVARNFVPPTAGL